MSTQTMTGAVNLSSSRKSMLSSMASTSPLTGTEGPASLICCDRLWRLNLSKPHLHQDPGPRRRKVLKEPHTYVLGTQTIHDVPEETNAVSPAPHTWGGQG